MGNEQNALGQFTAPPPWTIYLPDVPEFGHAVLLVAAVVIVLGAAHAFTSYWRRQNEAVPFYVALLLWAVVFGVYLALAAAFATYVEPEEKLSILAWCFFFWIPPVAYMTYTVVNSLAINTVDHIGPLSARIEEPSEFASARKLALRGDIDGAINMYRTYTTNQANALFEAARLLRSENRYKEAAELFDEIGQRFHRRILIWAEATYQHAKLCADYLEDLPGARKLWHEIIARSPEGRFGQLAIADLSRMESPVPEDDEAPLVGEKAPSRKASRSKKKKPGKGREAGQKEGEQDEAVADEAAAVAPVPEEDPFYAMRMGQREAAAKSAADNEKKTAGKKKAPAKKIAAAKKKAPAKKKPAAKKKAPAKKKPAAKKKAPPKKKAAAKKKAAPKKKAPAKKKAASA